MRRLLRTAPVALLALGVFAPWRLVAQEPLVGRPADPNAGAAIEKQPPPVDEPHRRRSTIYVANRASADVMIFSRDTAELIATIPVGRLPSGLAARSDGDRIYVACAGSHSIQVIDGATRKLLDNVSLVSGSAPTHIILSPDERTFYVAASGLDAVYVFDAGSLQQTGETPVGRRPTRLGISRDGRTLYVLSVQSGRVDIVDTFSKKVIASPSVGSQPSDLAVDRVTGTAYVVHSGAPMLHSIAEGEVQAREISIEAPAESLAADSSARRLLLASPSSGRILLLAPATGASTMTIRVSEVSRMVIDPEGRNLYALSARKGMMSIINRIVGTVEREVPVGKEPWDLVLIP